MNRRRSKRRSLTLSAFASLPRASEIPVLIRDISPGGLLIQADSGTLRIDDQVLLDLIDGRTVLARVAWTSERLFGCEFASPISVGAISAALLRGEAQSRSTVSGDHLLPELGMRGEALEPESNLTVALALGFLLWAGAGAMLALML
jgi:hypothetical protein